MTMLEPPPVRTESKPSRQERPRSLFVKHLVAHGWLHLLLLSFVALFLFPFVWMVATSLKTDEEIADTSWFPSVPQFRAASPYVRSAPEIDAPVGILRSAFDEATPKLIELTREALKGVPRPSGAEAVDATAYRDSAVNLLINKLTPKLNQNLWTKGGNELFDAYKRLLTPEVLGDALADRLSRVELRALQVRSLDAHIYPLCAGDEFVSKWKVESGDAKLLAGRDGTILSYRFASPDVAPVVLRYDFDFPCAASELHKLLIGVRPDDSWHRAEVTLDVGGKRFGGERPWYLAQNRAASMLFQPVTFEDQTYKAKVWITLEEKSEVRSQNAEVGNKATLRVTLRPSSTTRAIYGKVERNYARAFNSVPFWLYVGNSVWLVALTMAGTLFSSTFVAYAFARLHWPGRGLAFVILLSTMMLPAQVTMIPSFLIWRSVGWYNTLNPLWVPAWFGGAFFIFLMVQHMKTIPKELEEAARIDGLGPFCTWAQIIVPQVKPSLAAIAIMTFMGAWNEFMGPLIYLRDQAKFPLSLGLFGIRVDAGPVPDWTLIMAGNMLMTLPVIVVFFLFQRYFIQGMTMSGMKG